MGEELKPCPFCGGSVSVGMRIGDWLDEDGCIDGDSHAWAIHHNDLHSKCELRSFSVPGEYRTIGCKEADEQKRRLITVWNTRNERPRGNPTLHVRVEFAGAVEPWAYPLALDGRLVDAVYIDGVRYVPTPVVDWDGQEVS